MKYKSGTHATKRLIGGIFLTLITIAFGGFKLGQLHANADAEIQIQHERERAESMEREVAQLNQQANLH
jgi:type VI protein secretion system component VasK